MGDGILTIGCTSRRICFTTAAFQSIKDHHSEQSRWGVQPPPPRGPEAHRGTAPAPAQNVSEVTRGFTSASRDVRKASFDAPRTLGAA